MSDTYCVSLELSETELYNLKSFITDEEIVRADIYYRYLTLEKVVKAIFSVKEQRESSERVRNSGIRCKCGHLENFHSVLGDKICTAESCPCMSWNRV